MHQHRDAAQELSHRERVVIVVGVMIGAFLAALDSTIVAAALPRIAGELGGIEHLSWIVTAYLLTSTATTPIHGKLGDLYGRCAIMTAAIVIFVAASVLCALSQTMIELALARALQGVGGGGLLVTSQAVIGDIMAPRERGRYMAYIAGMWAIASISGPVLGGVLAEYASWRVIFWINLPLGAPALALCWVILRRLPRPHIRRRIDYPGAVLLVSAVTVLLLVTTWGGAVVPWSLPQLQVIAATGLLLAAAFVVWEWRASEPILAPRLFGNPIFCVINLVSFIASMAFTGAIVFLPLHAQLVVGATPAAAGLLLLPMTIGATLSAMISGRIMVKTGRYKALPIVGLAVAAICFFLFAQRQGGGYDLALLAYGVLAGAGLGAMFPIMVTAMQNAVAREDMGAATASISFFRSLVGSFGVAALSAMLLVGLEITAMMGVRDAVPDEVWRRVLHEGSAAFADQPAEVRAAITAAARSTFETIFLACAGAAAAACFAALFLREIPLRSRLESG